MRVPAGTTEILKPQLFDKHYNLRCEPYLLQDKASQTHLTYFLYDVLSLFFMFLSGHLPF